jgi:molybdenum cofactor guanylyltransferase
MGRDSHGVAGLLLTGGTSRRMGFDKSRLTVEGTPMARRVARALAAAAAPVLEVGPGTSGLPTVAESKTGEGPLFALTCGARELRRRGHYRAVLLVACDLPFLSRDGLVELAGWPSDRSVVPAVAGRPQPLCAKWSTEDLDVADRLVARGERSMRALVAAVRPVLLDVEKEMTRLTTAQLVDLDTRDDAQRLQVAIAFPRLGERDRSSVRSL